MHKKLIFLIILLVFTFGCQSQENGDDPISEDGPVVNDEPGFEMYTIFSEGSFGAEDCEARGLNDRVIMIESKYCGACKATMPVFEEACAEKGVSPLILDIAEKGPRLHMESFGVMVQYTPTFIIGCDYFVGGMTKNEYLSSLDKFLEANK